MTTHDNPAQYVQKYIGYSFRDHAIVEEAVSRTKNKRLGFLGDKVVGLLLLDAWYRTRSRCGMSKQSIEKHVRVSNNLRKWIRYIKALRK